MSQPATHQITQILMAAGDSDPAATDRLLPLVYEELRQLAHQRLAAESPGLTLQTTALVHEAYLRLVGDESLRWENRAHFFGAAARAMRRILVEHARKRASGKHGGGRRRVSLDDANFATEDQCEELLALDEALTKLETQDKRKTAIVMLRFFSGLTIEDTAKALRISATTVKEDWSFARAWLYAEMGYDHAA